MKTRADTVATIGFDGNAAVVDRYARGLYGKMETSELADAGYYRAAAAAALHSGNPAELELVAKAYNKASGSSYQSEAIPRLFGVAQVGVTKTLVL